MFVIGGISAFARLVTKVVIREGAPPRDEDLAFFSSMELALSIILPLWLNRS